MGGRAKIERRHDYWQKRLPPLLAADQILAIEPANTLLDQLLAHAHAHESHREIGSTPSAAHQQALAQNRAKLRPPPTCPWWRFVWSLRSSVRVGDDGKVPVRSLRLSVDAPPRARLPRCLLPDGDIFFLKSPPSKTTLPLILLHSPVF